MAGGGHYEYKWVEDARGVAKKVAYWVPDKPNPKADAAARERARRERERAARSAAQRRSADAARRAASQAAARIAESRRQRVYAAERASEARAAADRRALLARRQAESRRLAFETLKQRQAEVLGRRDGVVGPAGSRPPAGPGRDYQDQRAEREALLRRQRERVSTQRQSAAAATAQRTAAERDHWTSYQQEWEKRNLLQRLSRQQAEPLTSSDYQQVERLLAREAEKAKTSGQFDAETVRTLGEKYDTYAEKVYKDYETLLTRFFAEGKRGNIEAQKKLYKEIAKAQPEFFRLFGDGSNPGKDGAYSEFWRQQGEIAAAQREWWKRQTRSALQTQVDRYKAAGRHRRTVVPGQREAEEMLGILDGKVDTRLTPDGVTPDGRVKYRHMTVEEEFQARTAEKIMQQEKLRVEYGLQQKRQKALLMAEGMVEYKGQLVERRQLPIVERADALIERDFGGQWEAKRPEDIHDFVGRLLGDWERDNPPPKAKGDARAPGFQQKYRRWAAARDGYESEAYKFFGMGSPGLLERGMGLPGISGALQILQGGFSLTGAGLRAVDLMTGGVGKVGGVKPTLDDAPDTVRKLARRYAEDKLRAGLAKAGGGRASGGSLQQFEQEFFAQWLLTDEGKGWMAQTIRERTGQSVEDLKKFAAEFYGTSDVGTNLRALNEYGAAPFQNEGANLLSSLLLDPFNVVPLKFTTYLARGKYAFEMTKGAKAAFRPFAAGSKFLTVDEGVLDAWKYFNSLEKELKAAGMTRDRFLDLLRERVVGVKTAEEGTKRLEQLFREVGLNPRKVNENQLFNLAEAMGNARALDEGRSLFTQAQKMREEIRAAEKAQKEAETARAAKAREEQARVQRELREKRRVAEEQRTDLRVARKQQEKELEARAAQEPKASPAAGFDEPVNELRADHELTLKEPPKPDKLYRVELSHPHGGPIEVFDNYSAKDVESIRTDLRGRADAPGLRVFEQRGGRTAEPPDVSGPADSAVYRVETEALSAQVRDRAARRKAERYTAADEFYVRDARGNLLPKDSSLVGSKNTKALEERALAGDTDADEALRLRARMARNRFKMEMQDPRRGVRRRDRDWRMTSYDVAEAGHALGDADAAARLNYDRREINYLVRRASTGNDDHVSRFVRREKASRGMHGQIYEEPSLARSEMDEWIGMEGTPPEYIAIGDDILSARDASLGKLHRVYQPFSHDNLRYYTSGTENHWLIDEMRRLQDTDYVVKRMTRDDFLARIAYLRKMEPGVGSYRDMGQWVFEVFHQLRLAKEWDKLREFSDAVTPLIVDEAGKPLYDNIFAWQWKVMEERVGLPYAMHPDVVEEGFLEAAEAFSLHAELALTMVPYGYVADLIPQSFGLTARLDEISRTADWFTPAPTDYGIKQAREDVTKVMMGGRGASATQIVHYAATRFGNFVKGHSQGIYPRMLDELTQRAIMELGVQAVSDAVVRQGKALAPKLLRLSQSRGQPVVEIIDAALDASRRKWGWQKVAVGRDSAGLRPAFADLRGAVERAYWAGDLPIRNPRAHVLMFLTAVQTDPDAWMGAARTFGRYMQEIGHLEDAQRLLRDMFDGEWRTDFTRAAVESSGRGKMKTASGIELSGDGTQRMALWRELGMAPDEARLLAHAEGRAAERAESLASLEDEVVDMRGDRGRFPANVDLDGVAEDVASLITDFRATKSARLRMKYLGQARGKILGAVRRVADTGGITTDFLDALDGFIARLNADEFPEMRQLLHEVSQELGDTLLGERLRGAIEPLAHREAILRMREKWLRDEAGNVRKGLEREAARVERELGQVRDAKNAVGGRTVEVDLIKDGEIVRGRVRAPDPKRQIEERRTAYEGDAQVAEALRVETNGRAPTELSEVTVEARPDAPVTTAPRSAAETMLAKLRGMTEEEWYAAEKNRAARVLRAKNASAERKAAARKRIDQIEAAEYAIKVERSRGTYVPWRERAAFQRKVDELFGEDAVQYFAPKLIAPLVHDAREIAVEQARTLYRLLRRASPIDKPSVYSIRVGGEVLDHLPREIYEELDRLISAELERVRGYRADTLTGRRGRNGKNLESDRALGALRDSDPEVIAAKQRVLTQYYRDKKIYVPMPAYDEARKALRPAYVQSRNAGHLLREAERLAGPGATPEAIEGHFLSLRAEQAAVEARKQLGGLAFGEYFGVDPEVIFSEYAARYTDDGTLRHYSPTLTAFQRKTIEAHFESLSGLTVSDDAVGAFLQSANRPPLHNRELTRDFLTRTGAWSPRKAEDFIQGERSWSIYDEAAYWRDTFGEVPEWADRSLLASEFNDIFHDYQRYSDQMKAWGIFSRSQELALRLDGKTMAEIEAGVLRGDPQLGLPARRDLELQRRYVIERFGPLVSRDGRTLDAMPWLMYPSEYRVYLTRRTAQGLPDGMIQTAAELDEVQGLISKALDQVWDKYIGPKAVDEPISYEDIFRVASDVQATLLANPKWARRWRDVLGTSLDAWAWFNRWLVFSNPAFAVMNVVDAPIKGAMYRFTRHGLFNPDLARANAALRAEAEALVPEMFGLDHSAAMYRTKNAPVRERLRNPRGFSRTERVVDRALAAVEGTGAAFPYLAGQAETAMKMRLAKGMYPQVYTDALKRFNDPELARAAALGFIKKEINRLWPTAGDGPIERLWNRFVPFASYTVRNKVVFLSEAASHPYILNWLNRVGDYIEAHNRREWEKANPGQPMPDNLARLVKLPWTEGWIDLGQFSDASRGLAPLTKGAGWKSNLDRIAEWVRVVNPSVQAGIYGLMNAFNVGQRVAWKPVVDANGFPTGKYTMVTVGWTEPWSKDAPGWGSVFWFVDAIETGQKYGIDGFSALESTALVSQVFLFNAVKTYDQMSVRFGWFRGLSKADQEKFLATAEGRELAEWLAAKVGQPTLFKGDVFKFMQAYVENPSSWWFRQNPQWRARVNEARDKITRIRDAFAAELAGLVYGTAEYKELKARMYLAISDVYGEYPELMQADVWSKSPSQWATQLEDWAVDKLMDDFMSLSGQRPKRADYADSKAYNAAVAAWERQKAVFLARHPQVKERLGTGIVQVDAVRDRIERDWDRVLGRIGERTEAIEQAKAIIAEAGRDSVRGRTAQDRLDILYLEQDLDYTLLERDYAATYFDQDDFERLPSGLIGPPAPRQQGLLPRVRQFMDFDRTLFEKAKREGRLDEYFAKAEYGKAMREATMYAKGNDPFGEFNPARWMKYMKDHPDLMEKYFANNPGKRDEWARNARYIEGIRRLWNLAGNDPGKWVKLLKRDKWLLEEYFRRNPEKRAKWARTDAYIRHISVWGQLARAGKWDAAEKAWNALPGWVKEEYFSRHPEKRGKRERAAKTVEYMGYMDRWVKMFEAGKKDEAMDFFRSMPGWVRERYFSKHPENRLRFEEDAEMSARLRDYFAGTKEGRAAYLAKHPELRKWLAKNAGSKELERLAILQTYRTIPKDEAWLRKVFREKYPEIFSQEALGERRLKKVYDTLAKHPDVLPDFERWVDLIWKTYDEMLRLGQRRPLSSYITRDRDEELRLRLRRRSRSAAEVSGG